MQPQILWFISNGKNHIGGVMVRRARLEGGRSWVRVPGRVKTKDYTIGICYFSTKYAALGSQSKDWLAQHQDNVFEWSDMSTKRTVVSVN
jgi:hypothetical protein